MDAAGIFVYAFAAVRLNATDALNAMALIYTKMRPPMTSRAEELTEEPKLGQWLRGIYASKDNPQRDGMYVETIRRTGRLNPGKFYRITDGKGRFWSYPANSVAAIPAPVAAIKSEPMP